MMTFLAVLLLLLLVVVCASSTTGSDDGGAGEETVFELTPETATPSRVEELVHQGIPFVIRGEASTWPAVGKWNLAWLKAKFGRQVKNRHPDRGEALFDGDGTFAGYFDVSDEEWEAFLEAFEAEDAGQPNIAWQCRNASASEQLREDYKLPRPLAGLGQDAGDYVSEHGARETLFFALEKGEGREPHIDYSCNSAWSAQIQGEKEWRLWPPDHCQNHLFTEGQAEDAPACTRAQPLRVVLRPGDVLFWYPGWMHATRAIAAPSLGLSREFFTPLPRVMLAEHDAIYRAHSAARASYTRCFKLWHDASGKYAGEQASENDRKGHN
ncbi:hypothetical protein PTSG_07165 [Salpingoeca rosetta]|uniref:JmjC domain-containing protein n=1 Tax=Salpingoeca rosetta (strain ATCC 50818 / BSB-021) TaxID=946362 RepID=F2UE91_SALR5|nr:uncharacterized protein PTSG_07165 [Salpingoeca rosetta]EGD74941.1 hypothetical protein PTSG_07165 [Salpingoeca rosetta]|eukprot:XP_004992586.1 hypothetical protein PTSG_07165 [Salpingoeca rosetta]